VIGEEEVERSRRGLGADERRAAQRAREEEVVGAAAPDRDAHAVAVHVLDGVELRPVRTALPGRAARPRDRVCGHPR